MKLEGFTKTELGGFASEKSTIKCKSVYKIKTCANKLVDIQGLPCC